jgi:hypothetical protein
VSASHLLGGSGKSSRAYQGAFVRAHILDQSEERFNAGNVDRPCVNANIVALWRIPSAMSMTTSPQAGQKSPVTSGMMVDSPL